MRLKKKVERWVEEALIDAEAGERILAHEEAHSRSKSSYAVTGLASISVVLGLLSLVAANWNGLSDVLKLGIDFGIGIGLFVGIQRIDSSERTWVRETLIVILAGWVLASIALVGQIFQTGGSQKDAVLLWAMLTFPLFAQGRSVGVGVFWLGSLLLGFGALYEDLSRWAGATFYVALIPTLSWALLWITGLPKIRKMRPESASVFSRFFTVTLLSFASLGTLAFYGVAKGLECQKPVMMALVASLPFVGLMWRRMGTEKVIGRSILWVSYGMMYLPWLLSPPKVPFFGVLFATILFIGFWGLVARVALYNGHRAFFRFATFVIALRLFGIYLELIGTLLDTGLVFLTGGILTLVGTRYWNKKSRALLEEKAKENPTPTPGIEPEERELIERVNGEEEMPLPGERLEAYTSDPSSVTGPQDATTTSSSASESEISPDRAPKEEPGLGSQVGEKLRNFGKGKTLSAVALLVIVGIVASVGIGYKKKMTSRLYTLEVEGYDPRDLLYGHYLRIQYILPIPKEGPLSSRGGNGYCFMGDEAPLVVTSSNKDEWFTQMNCTSWVPTNALKGPKKYHVPEAYALELEKALETRKGTIVLGINKHGQVSPSKLFLDGIPWEQALKD